MASANGVASLSGILPLSCSSVSSRLPSSRAHKPSKLPRRGFPSLKSSKETSTTVFCSPQQPDQPLPEDDASLFPEDFSYLGELAVGSVVGASMIKYGSILFPEITKPSLAQGLLMFFVPVLVAVLILIKESSLEGQKKNFL